MPTTGLNPSERRISRIHDLTLKWHQGLHGIALIQCDEEKRRIRLQVLEERDQNAMLKDMVYRTESRRHHEAGKARSYEVELRSVRKKVRSQESQFQKQRSEIIKLKAEIESFNSSAQDSGKLLQEKFALVRELDRLRPEIDHLHSQMSSYQQVVAEKHKLQRQLDTIEVELENEKRTKQKVRDKENDTTVAALKARAKEAEDRLATERKARDKTNKALEKALADVTNQKANLEKKLTALEVTLAEMDAELRRTNVTQVTTAGNSQARALGQKPIRNGPAGRKRKIGGGVLDESTLQTPEHEQNDDRRLPKKRGGELPNLGEKSMFSVTPFLNRQQIMSKVENDSDLGSASSIEGDSSAAYAHHNGSDDDMEDVELTDKPVIHSIPPGHHAAARKPDNKGAGSAPKAGARVAKKSTSSRKAKNENQARSNHENVTVEKGSSPVAKVQTDPGLNLKPHLSANIELASSTTGDANTKKKRRKLLGGASNTIFDEEEDEVPHANTDPTRQGVKRNRAPLGGAANAFGATSFSPLKRDRRGVGASFLG